MDAMSQVRALGAIYSAHIKLGHVETLPNLGDVDPKSDLRMMACGWHVQPFVDLVAAGVLYQVMHLGGHDGLTIDMCNVPPSVRMAVKDMVKNEKKISARVRSYFKKMQGPDQRLRKMLGGYTKCVRH